VTKQDVDSSEANNSETNKTTNAGLSPAPSNKPHPLVPNTSEKRPPKTKDKTYNIPWHSMQEQIRSDQIEIESRSDRVRRLLCTQKKLCCEKKRKKGRSRDRGNSFVNRETALVLMRLMRPPRSFPIHLSIPSGSCSCTWKIALVM